MALHTNKVAQNVCLVYVFVIPVRDFCRAVCFHASIFESRFNTVLII
uniref:Uncharacterized protein n=1 Tax=Anguilla anguilla TaxID=7936 RepID=A0A0E9V672_ANGAN